MSEQPHRPTTADPDAWRAYWQAQGMPWRMGPEVDEERQRFLAERRAIKSDIERGIYPYRGIKLTRADVEWLLETHRSGGMQGPVDWSDEKQRNREGLDLRGANLAGASLSGMPLANTVAGLTYSQWYSTEPEQREMATVHLERAYLRATHLEGANFGYGRLEEAFLSAAHLQQAKLRAAHLEGATFIQAHLEGADLRRAFFNAVTNFIDVALNNQKLGCALLADIRWNNANLAVVDWSSVEMLGDERIARQHALRSGSQDTQYVPPPEFGEAVRANRQLALMLRAQGLNEHADRFAYRAQVLQRRVLRQQRKVGPWLFSWFLYLASGYGFRLWQILLSYGVAVTLFAALYYAAGALLGSPEHTYTWYQAILVSVTNIHGRIFTGLFVLDTVQAWLAAMEAVVGLVIEGVFVAMLVQRFFAR